MTDKAREEFEAWLKQANRSCASARNDSGGYHHYGTQSCWEAWQASRAAIVIELPAADGEFEYPHGGTTYFDGAEYRDACVKAIEAAGLKLPV